jgi:hypothetical protein
MRRVRVLQATIRLALCLALPAVIGIRHAGAATTIDGDATAVRLEAHDASIEEILTALHARFGVTYRGVGPPTRRISATLEGPLNRVLMQVLSGYDFVIKRNGDTLDINVLNGGAPRQAVPSPFLRGRSD